jgi:hypothetical protein
VTPKINQKIDQKINDAIDPMIRRAIAGKKLLRFTLDGAERLAEPHDYGIRNGVPQLLVFQIGGASRSGGLPDWRWVDLSRAAGFEILDQTFPGSRAAPSGKHARWDRLFARVDQQVDERDGGGARDDDQAGRSR